MLPLLSEGCMGAPPSEREKHVLEVLSLLSRKWHPRIVMALHADGPLGFNALEDRLPGISGKVLSNNLGRLCEKGLVDRVVLNESPLRVEYALTEAGTDLVSVFDELAAWGVRHLDHAKPHVLIADGERRLTDIYRHWLAREYVVSFVHDADAFRAQLDETVDVVVFDAGLPGATPTDVQALVGTVDESCRTILLTADRPTFDLLDVESDVILRKPLSKELLCETIQVQLERQDESPRDRERHALEERRSILEETYPPSVLDEDERYRELCDRITRLSGDVGVEVGH